MGLGSRQEDLEPLTERHTMHLFSGSLKLCERFFEITVSTVLMETNIVETSLIALPSLSKNSLNKVDS